MVFILFLWRRRREDEKTRRREIKVENRKGLRHGKDIETFREDAQNWSEFDH
jgi:hypothetical protein